MAIAASGSSREVVVSPFSPLHDGIAKYADQFAQAIARERPVLTIGLPGSAADRVLRLDGGLRPLRLLSATRRTDRVWIMWHPQYFISGRFYSRALSYVALGFVLRRRLAMVILQVEESDRSRLLEQTTQRWCWRASVDLLFHTDGERARFEERFGVSHSTMIVPNGAFYRPYAEATRMEARTRLGVEWQGPLFVCLGFIGGHKGFDRAIRAFGSLPAESARLYIVGSTLYGSEIEREHVAELQRLADRTRGVEIHERWLEDEGFDLWLLAADALVAPYRGAASSGVIARARLLGTRVVAASVGGIPEQLGSEDVIVHDDEQLSAAVRAIASQLGVLVDSDLELRGSG